MTDLSEPVECVWKELSRQANSSSFQQPNQRLKVCLDKCNGYGEVEGNRYICQVYQQLYSRGLLKEKTK